MANCLLNKNLTKTDFCGYSLKQITDIYLANYSEVVSKDPAATGTTAVEGKFTLEMDTDGYTVKKITATANSGGTSPKFARVEPAKDSSSYNDDLVVGGNGSKYRTHSITFSFNGAYSAVLAEVLDSLSLGRFIAVLKLSDNSYVMLGRLTGLEASAASSLSEAAADGMNGINVTLECNTVEPALVLSPDAVTTLLANVVTDAAGDEGE